MIIWNLFEQSGTFKKVLQEKNYTSYDVDIVKTENVDFNIDLFKEITNYYQGIDLDNNLFSKINKDDIVFSLLKEVILHQLLQKYLLKNMWGYKL